MGFLMDLWEREPARVSAFVASVVVFVCAKAGIIVSSQDVINALLLVVPLLVAGEASRHKVIPLGSITHAQPPQDDEVDQEG